jgi:hypothetical protein
MEDTGKYGSKTIETKVTRVEAPKKEEKMTFDTNAVLVTLYIFYKANLLSRDNLRILIDTLKKGDVPNDLLKYFVEEIAR